MAIYHLNVKMVSRGKGQSVIASSAYRSGQALYDKETNTTHDYTKKQGVVFSEIMLPEHAPKSFADRSVLWSEVQQIEKQSNAQLAREVEVALPIELSREQHVEILRSYINAQFVQEGMVADYSIHDKDDGNPHAHILLTTRPIKPDGTWGAKEKKGYALDEAGNRIPQIDPATGEQKLGKRNEKIWKRETVQANNWNDRSNMDRWRESWAMECNRYLTKEKQIDHRSHKDRGIEQEPTIHEGYVARKVERQGGVGKTCQINREIVRHNQLGTDLAEFVQGLRLRFQQLLQELKQQWNRVMEQKRALEQREKEIQRQRQDSNERFQPFSAIDDLSPSFGIKKAIQPTTGRHEIEEPEKMRQKKYGNIEDLRPDPELAKQSASQTPNQSETSPLKEQIQRLEEERNRSIILSDGRTFGFEIQVGEYLNMDRYDEPIKSHRIEKIDEDFVTWNGREWHVKELESMSYRYTISKSAEKIEPNPEKERYVDQGFEIE